MVLFYKAGGSYFLEWEPIHTSVVKNGNSPRDWGPVVPVENRRERRTNLASGGWKTEGGGCKTEKPAGGALAPNTN